MLTLLYGITKQKIILVSSTMFTYEIIAEVDQYGGKVLLPMVFFTGKLHFMMLKLLKLK